MFPKQIRFINGDSIAEFDNTVTHANGKKLTEPLGVYIYKDMNDGRRYSKAGMKLELTIANIEKMKSNFVI